MPDSALQDALAARDRLLHAEDRTEELRIAYHQAIRRLHANGASMREIADSLALSHQRVHQIVNGGGDMTTPTPRRGRRATLLGRLTGRDRGRCESGDARVPLDRFFVDARDVLSFAQDEARDLKHDYIGTEHVLLGLIRADNGLAARILAALGVELQPTREAIVRKLGRSGSGSVGAIAPAARVKKVLELSHREAREHRSTHVRSEHLLLALAREGEGVGARILAEQGVVYGSFRRRVDRAACTCSFCGRSGVDVDHLVAGPGVYICEHCVTEAWRLAENGQPEGAGARMRVIPECNSRARCSFCGKSRGEVDRLVGGPGDRSICGECLALCREIHQEERRG